MPPTQTTLIARRLGRLIGAAAFTLCASAQAATPAELQAGYSAQAATAPVAMRGQQLFTERHGRDWSCASCHGTVPTQPGKHASTGKPIAPLAPAFNAERFTDATRSRSGFAATATT
jgi:hypothetical protein